MRTLLVAMIGMASLVSMGAVEASDRWETSFNGMTDDDASTQNNLRHGVPQIGHDLEGTAAAPDEDWMVFGGKPGHSYEVHVSGAGMYWGSLGCPTCPRLDRVDNNGVILTPGTPSTEDESINFGLWAGLAVRWISTGGLEFVRTHGDESVDLPAGLTYDVEFYDTTYFLPRFNNSATQITVLIVENTTTATVTGDINFYSAAGTLLHTQPLNVPWNGVQVFNSSTIPALQGQSGSVAIAHDGGYGALVGKGVALEPATGFTFDTVLTPLPR